MMDQEILEKYNEICFRWVEATTNLYKIVQEKEDFEKLHNMVDEDE